MMHGIQHVLKSSEKLSLLEKTLLKSSDCFQSWLCEAKLLNLIRQLAGRILLQNMNCKNCSLHSS